jgi:hypothetical protein
MTYQEIISQVARKLGYSAFNNQLKADLRYAIRFSEEELQRETQMVKRSLSLDLDKDTASYDLPDNYSEPKEIIIKSSDGAELSYHEVPFEQWLRYSPDRIANTSATENEILKSELSHENYEEGHRFRNKVLVAIAYQEDFNDAEPPVSQGHKYRIYVKPGIDGVLEMYYTPVFVKDPFAATSEEPPYPLQYHKYIIIGATAYLAQNEASRARANGDIEGAIFFSRVARLHQEEFEHRKQQVIAKVDKNKSAGIVNSFVWYDSPGKYR